MTFVTMRWVQQNALDVFKAPKTVLAFMAMKAHFDDGTAAWPAMDTIAVECGLSVRTVQRAIMQLVDMGYLELGQQDFSRVDPRTGRQVRNDRRTTVWNVICKTPRLELEAETVEEPNGDGMAACVRYARRASTKGPGSERSGKAEPVCENVTPCGTEMSPRDEAPGNERGDISARNPAKMSPNIQEIHINPSAPTGHLPASGANPGEDTKPKPDDSPGPTRLEAERWLGAETAPVARDDSPLTPSDEEDLVCRALERGWSLDPAM
ncbi:zinc finger protein, partial [Bifidobacterium saguini DSM 23967]